MTLELQPHTELFAMQDRIRKFIEPGSNISEPEILSEYLIHLGFEPENSTTMTQSKFVSQLLEEKYVLAKTLKRFTMLSSNVHEFMFLLTFKNFERQIIHRVMVQFLRQWSFRSGMSPVVFIDLKKMAAGNISDLLRMLYTPCDISVLELICKEYSIELENNETVRQLEESLREGIKRFLLL